MLRIIARSKQRKQDRADNIQKDAGGEKRFVRPLKTVERDMLHTLEQFPPAAYKHGILLGTISLGYLLYLYFEQLVIVPWYLYGILPLMVTLLYLCMLFLAHRKNYLYYYDLRTNAVMQVTGDLVKECTYSGRNRICSFVVRGRKVNASTLPVINYLFDRFTEDEVVRLEFLPYSGLVMAIASVAQPEHTYAYPWEQFQEPVPVLTTRTIHTKQNTSSEISRLLKGKK